MFGDEVAPDVRQLGGDDPVFDVSGEGLSVEPVDEDVDYAHSSVSDRDLLRACLCVSNGLLTDAGLDVDEMNDVVRRFLPRSIKRVVEVLGVVHEDRFVNRVSDFVEPYFDADDAVSGCLTVCDVSSRLT